MADTKTEKQKVKEITDRLEEGLKELFESEKYKSYLSTMSKFHNYSVNNTLLISLQMPEATLVAGYKAWQKNFGRHVNKGEKAIRILAPSPYIIKEERDKLDPVTGELMFDENGMPLKEEVEIKIPAFQVVSVFDVSQTDGKPLPELGEEELLATVEGYEDFKQAVINVAPVPVGFEDIPGDSKGYFSIGEKRIAVQEGMSESQTLKTMVHEVAHSMLHDKDVNRGDVLEPPAKDRNTKEVEAESIAYIVCQHFGIDTSDYSFGYIAGWSSDKNMKELKSSLDTIRKTASELITGIEAQLQELQLDRELMQEQEKESLLLIQNSDLSEYSLVNVRGMDAAEIVEALSAMNDDDRQSVSAYLESKGAWVTEIANEGTKEFGEYHPDVRYITDTNEVIDLKVERELNEREKEPVGVDDAANKGAQLLYGSSDKYGIYQLKDNPELNQYRFEGTGFLVQMGLLNDHYDEIRSENYELIYTGELSEIQGDTQNGKLEAIFEKFNLAHPEDFKGHSLSVSDVVVLHENGKNSAHYVDSYGFTRLPEFMKELEGVKEQGQELDTSGQDVQKSEPEEQKAQEKENAPEYIYKVEANPRSDSIENLYFLQAYEVEGLGRAIPRDVLYVGTPDKCRELMGKLVSGEMTQSEVKELFTKAQETMQEPERADAEQSEQAFEDGDEIIDLGDDREQVLAEMRKILESGQETELAFSIADRFISIQEVEGGYDYSIMGTDYKVLEGGLYDDPDVSIQEALNDIVEDLKTAPRYNGAAGNIGEGDELIPIDYDELMEKVESASRIEPQSSVVADFKAKTAELFHEISEMNPAEIEETVKCHVQAILDETGIDAVIVDAAVVGSRCRGLEHDGSDLDVVVELSTNEREDVLFDTFNENGLRIGGIKVDINPITAERTGTLETYLPQVEDYLAGVREAREQEAAQKAQEHMEAEKKEAEVTLTVAECSEFHNLGEFYENIPTVEEAIAIWKQIPPERINGIPAIGINVHRPGEESHMDDAVDLLSGNRIDLEMLRHCLGITSEPKAMEVIAELVAKLPEMEIDGNMSEEFEAKVWEKRMPDLTPAEQLAVEIDRFTYDYDTALYHDSIQNMTENISEIVEVLNQRDTQDIAMWLANVVTEGTEPEETKRAMELLERLAEYKPLAKIVEMEEQNYNMIDNVLNNGAGEKVQREAIKNEQERPTARTSLKARLAEKRAQVAGHDHEKDNNRNNRREI